MRTMTLGLATMLLLAGCSDAGDDTAGTSPTSSTTAPAPGQTTSGSTGRADEHHDHEHDEAHGEDPGHLDVACEAELASMQGGGSGARVLSVSVMPDLTCQEAVPAVRALDELAPFGEAPPTLEAEGFTCETSSEDFEGQPIEVFRCEDDRGTLVWVRG